MTKPSSKNKRKGSTPDTWIDLARRRVNLFKLSHRALKHHLNSEQEKLEQVRELVDSYLEAQSIAQSIAQEVQERAHQSIASIVSRCLAAIFPDPYVFKINFQRKRGRTEPEFVIERDGIEISPMEASGGGVIDVIVFALRLASIILIKPPGRKIMILDEPFKYVSQDLQSSIRGLLDSLAKDLEVQFIIVTHQTQLIDDNSIRF